MDTLQIFIVLQSSFILCKNTCRCAPPPPPNRPCSQRSQALAEQVSHIPQLEWSVNGEELHLPLFGHSRETRASWETMLHLVIKFQRTSTIVACALAALRMPTRPWSGDLAPLGRLSQAITPQTFEVMSRSCPRSRSTFIVSGISGNLVLTFCVCCVCVFQKLCQANLQGHPFHRFPPAMRGP